MTMDLATLVLLVLQVSLGLIVFCLGLQVDTREFAYLYRQPSLLARSLLSMNVVMPALTVALVLAFRLTPIVEALLLALSLSPVPPVLPGKTLKAGGSSAYVFSLLATVSVLAIAFVPIGVEVFERVFHVPLQMSPVAVAKVVSISILAPLAAGLAVGRFGAKLAERIARPLSRLATVMLAAGFLALTISALPVLISLLGNGTLAAVVGFSVAGYVVGHLLGGPEPENRTVLANFTASRHPGMAMAIIGANFPGQKQLLGAAVLYLLVNAVISIGYQAWRRRQVASAVI
jgi:BASS family bile acid:Na+ symporter